MTFPLCERQRDLSLRVAPWSQSSFRPTLQFSLRFPRQVGTGIASRSLQVAWLIGRRARRFRQYDDPNNQERRTSVEDGHVSPPPSQREAVFFRPVARMDKSCQPLPKGVRGIDVDASLDLDNCNVAPMLLTDLHLLSSTQV